MQILTVTPPASPLEMSVIRAALSALAEKEAPRASASLRYKDAARSGARLISWAALARLEALDDGV